MPVAAEIWGPFHEYWFDDLGRRWKTSFSARFKGGPLHVALDRFVFVRDDATCLRCFLSTRLPVDFDGRSALWVSDANMLVADHVLPLRKGVVSHPDNMQTLCFSCNASKGDTCIDYRALV